MSNPWFRMYSEFMHDPKVQIMSEHNQRRLLMIFCMRCNGDVTLHDAHVTFQLRISQEEWEQSKAVFMASGFIDSANKVLNWDKRQFVSDSSAARVAKHRALHKTVTVTPCNVTVTPPEQNRTDTEQIKSLAIGKPNCPHQEVINLYHEILPNNPMIRDWTPARQALLKARWNEDSERQNLDYWRSFFEYVAKSSFLTGKTTGQNGRGFNPGLDWILKAENFAKVREGRYEDKHGQ